MSFFQLFYHVDITLYDEERHLQICSVLLEFPDYVFLSLRYELESLGVKVGEGGHGVGNELESMAAFRVIELKHHAPCTIHYAPWR